MSNTDSILRQKIKRNRPKPMLGPKLDIGQYLEKAVSLAGLSVLDTQIEAKTDGAMPVNPAQFVDDLFENGLTLRIEAKNMAQIGIVCVDAEMISSLTDVLTGDLGGEKSTADARLPTDIDAALCTGFINGILAEIDVVMSEHQPNFSPAIFAITAREAEPSAHMFPDIPHVTITLTIDIEEGTRSGKISISVPTLVWGKGQSTTFSPPVNKVDPLWEDSLKRSVYAAPACLNAVLHRRKMPIGEIMRLKIGDILEFPASTLDSLSLECGHFGNPLVFMTARLGEYQEMRAARISNVDPANSAQDQRVLLGSSS
ncbi:MAG: FliM/FliN family flagellar motor switch protein [Rhodobacteraceae bacterium]|nr:FliM/FliN family flagellar motor switch protein [Paracoccaceae bacterium]